MTVHPIPPVYNADSRILILGSFPSVKSRESNFFYGHAQNRFWKLLACLFDCPQPESIDEKKNLLLSNGIAVWDVIASCDIDGSSDSSIKNVIPNDLAPILEQSKIKSIYTNGKTAHKFYKKYLEAQTGIEAVCLPSTSPANASFSLEKLCQSWKQILI